MDSRYVERYRDLYQKHWWWRARSEFVLRTLDRVHSGRGRETILDIGCGDGLFWDKLSRFGEVEGVEPCPELVSRNSVYRSRIYVCPFNAEFQPKKKYSLVLMLDVLEHMDNPVAVLRHVVELLSEEGTIIITVPAFMALWTNHDVLNRHFTRYTRSSLIQIARMAQLEIREAQYFFQWTCPVKWVQGFAERVFGLRPEPPSVPFGPINEALFWISAVEQRVFRKLAVPFGSSLMLVGTKRQSNLVELNSITGEP